MPCSKCGSLLIRDTDQDVCPKCSNIKLLNRELTIKHLENNLKEVEEALINHLKNRVEKNKILEEIAWQREKFSRDFFERYQGFDLHKFLSFNFLIYRIMKEPYFRGTLVTDYISEAHDISEAFRTLIQMKNEYLHFKQELAEATKSNGKIRIIPNEHYFAIINTYEDNDIMTKAKANEKLKEYKKIFNTIYKGGPRSHISYTPEKFIEKFYSTINQFYCALLRDEIYYKVFGLLQDYGKIGLIPGKLMDFVNSYQMYEGMLSCTTVNEFASRAMKHFGMKEKEVTHSMIFNENSSKFPMFLAINDTVYIPHRTAFLIYILLHAIVYKDLLDRETERRSKEFEKEEVKKSFENIGWFYFPNKKDKKQQSIEIDGIAIFERTMLVIECKGWKLSAFYEYKKTQEHLVRDIQGIVDGQKFTHEKPEKIPSLIEKVTFARANMKIWGLNPVDFDEVNGLVIIRSSPPIQEYKGIQIISVRDIPKMFDRGKLQNKAQ